MQWGIRMKNFLLFCLLIITLSTLAGGKVYWDNQINSVLADTVSVEEPMQFAKSEANDNPEEAAAKKEEMLMLDRLNYLPPELQQKFKEKINQKQPVHLMILGSSSTSEQKGAWPELLEKKLMKIYGDSLLKVTTKEIANKTSDTILAENLHKELVNKQPDILLIEPFLLYDNGEIGMKKRLKNLSVILEDFKKKNPDMKIILQPANPIYGAHYYLQEESELEKYTNKNNYIYLDHWKVWPDSNKKDIKDYLTKENLPNEKGNELWAKYLIDYFVREVKR
jgi:hypothetical protein